MNLKKVHHIAIIGSDYHKSKDFYVNKLGFSVIRENYRPERDDYKIDLQLDDMELELFIMKNHPERLSPEAYGLRHLAFRVESVDEFIIIFKDMLRFNIYISTAIIAIVFAVDELVYMPFSPGYDSNIIITITYILMLLTCILLVRPDKIIDMLIIDCFFHFLYNIIGTALMALSAAVYGAITGADPDTWFTISTSTASDEIIRYGSVVVAAAVATIIVLKCMSIILNLNLRLKLPLFLGTAVPMYTFMILKNLLVYDSSQLLSGTFVVCYGLLLTIIAISLFVFFINVFLKTKEDNQLAQLQIEAQNAHYQRVLKLQQELRETKHDLVNQMVAYRLSQNSSPDNDGN